MGLCCRDWAFSSCSEQGLLFVVVLRLPIAVASLVGKWTTAPEYAGSVLVVPGLSLPQDMWNLPRPGI